MYQKTGHSTKGGCPELKGHVVVKTPVKPTDPVPNDSQGETPQGENPQTKTQVGQSSQVGIFQTTPEVKSAKIFFTFKGAVQEHMPVILLVHGLGTTSKSWLPLQDRFCLNHATLTIDLRGFGLSEKPRDSPYSYDMFSDDLAFVLQTLGRNLKFKTVIYVGIDLGGSIGIHFTHKYPEFVEKLFVIGAGSLWVGDQGQGSAIWDYGEVEALWEGIEQNNEVMLTTLLNKHCFPERDSTSLIISKREGVKSLQSIAPELLNYILGDNNAQSFVYEDLSGVAENLAGFGIPLFIGFGQRSLVGIREQCTKIFSSWTKSISPSLIYQFSRRGSNIHISDPVSLTKHLNRFISLEDTQEK